MGMNDPIINSQHNQELNLKQQEAVTLSNQSALILAGAGSGKTKVLTSRFAWLIQNQISKTGNLSGNINYKDYGVQTSTGAEFEGFGNRSITDPVLEI